ncbi:helix-turn-helix domain-containing protein [Actinoplanes sp. NPDC026670]|uniref:helix-turn-helix domain-containing protein n=1 Tax=Actinoplanes sp. NPDC026670 TaxID=3154700 RepID=UPI0033C5EFE4
MTADPSGEAAEIPTEPLRLVLTIEQAARRLGIGRTLMYSLVMDGEIESVTIGRLRRIPVECLTEYVTKLRASQHDDDQAAWDCKNNGVTPDQGDAPDDHDD